MKKTSQRILKKNDCLGTFYHKNTIKSDINTGSYYTGVEYKQYILSKKLDGDYKEKKQNKEFMDVIKERKTVREFKNEPINIIDLMNILKYSIGENKNRKHEDITLRYVPSAGARYPLEAYVVVLKGNGVPKGIYHYNIKKHDLELLKSGDFTEEYYSFCSEQDLIRKASTIIVITAIFDRTTTKYGDRGYRYIMLDSGHVGQNISLLATYNDIGSTLIGGFDDERLKKHLELNNDSENTVYVCALG